MCLASNYFCTICSGTCNFSLVKTIVLSIQAYQSPILKAEQLGFCQWPLLQIWKDSFCPVLLLGQTVQPVTINHGLSSEEGSTSFPSIKALQDIPAWDSGSKSHEQHIVEANLSSINSCLYQSHKALISHSVLCIGAALPLRSVSNSNRVILSPAFICMVFLHKPFIKASKAISIGF